MGREGMEGKEEGGMWGIVGRQQEGRGVEGRKDGEEGMKGWRGGERGAELRKWAR